MTEPILHVFDLETTAYDETVANRFISRNGNLDYVQEFLRASEDPSLVSNHALFQAHERSQIVQMYANDIFAKGDRGWNKINPDDFLQPRFGDNSRFIESPFAQKHGFLSKAQKLGRLTEERRLGKFYNTIEGELKAGKSVALGGHNIGRFDLWALEHATHRYDSLASRRGQLARWVQEYGGRFSIRDSLAELHQSALAHAAGDIDFAVNHYAAITDIDRAYRVGGANLTNIGRALDYQFAAHDAVEDVGATAKLFGLKDSGKLDGSLLRRIFQRSNTPIGFSTKAEPVVEVAQETRRFLTPGRTRLLKYGALGAAAAGVATYLAHSTRRDRQTQITGLRDEGMAVRNRHRLTAFGSGWRGLQPTPEQFQLESESAYNPWIRGLGYGVTGTALYGVHRYMLANRPGYAQRLFNAAKKFEDYSPMHLGRTFALSERLTPYITPESLTYDRSLLVGVDGRLNDLGQVFQRQFDQANPGLFDVLKDVTKDKPLVFRGRRSMGSGYMRLADRAGIDAEAMFVPAKGRLAGTAMRYGQELSSPPIARSKATGWRRGWETFKNIRESQRISNWTPSAKALTEAGIPFQPFNIRAHGEGFQQIARNVRSRIGVEAQEAGERLQRLVAEVGLGLKPAEWNKAFHIPFVGEGGMVNQMLTRRVLPIALGLTAAGWLDYHLGHPSDHAINLGLKANVLRADLTDMLPGGRAVTDLYQRTVPGAQYAPLAIPVFGATIGAAAHYGKVLFGGASLFGGRIKIGKYASEELRLAASRVLPQKKIFEDLAEKGVRLASTEGLRSVWSSLGLPGKGAAIGLGLMLPFIPGMLGSRKSGQELRDIYSGEEPVPIRQGRWWEVGSTPAGGTRIKAWRPHWSVLHKARAEDASLYGSEGEKWKHNAFIHPFRWLRDPYWMEKQHYRDRPYPVSSPAFTNVPLVGPLLAATIGKVVKPPVRMHEEQWDGKNYSLYSTRLEPKGPNALPAPAPQDEYSLGSALKQEVTMFKEYTGALGYFAGVGWDTAFPDINKGKQVFFQGSRQMTNLSRRYYERELGAGLGPSPSMKEHFGYSEPLRRFIQRESFEPQANEIPNTMPSWLPGDDYMTNFKVGDPYVRVDDGYARLPGAGYEALHPELKGVNPEDYPDIHKLRILSDVAPYSREYNLFRQRISSQARNDTGLQIELDKIVDRVRQVKESSITMDRRRFTAPVDEIEGTVAQASPQGITLKEYPGRVFHFSSVGMTAADMSARVLGENNKLTREELATEVDNRRAGLFNWFADNVTPGGHARLTVPRGASESAEDIRAVVEVDGLNINRELIDSGFGDFRRDLGGAETQAMFGAAGNAAGKMGEALTFVGDSSVINPLRWMGSPGHTKIAQQRTAFAQYLNNEVIGTRMRRWDRPIDDMIMPYVRGTLYRATRQVVVPQQVQVRRDLNSLADALQYLRGLNDSIHGINTRKEQRTSVGANLFGSPTFVASTLPARETHYFREFLNETDPEKREKILDVASPELSRALSAQWVAQEARLREAEGDSPGEIGEGGRLYTKADLEEYEHSNTRLGYGDWLRSREVADFFSRTGFAMPDQDSEVLSDDLDYEDVKLKIIQQEGYDSHDFNLFDDRSALLWRKPYVDGAVRELTSGDTSRSAEQLRQSVERMILTARDHNPKVRTSVHASPVNSASVRIDASIDKTDELLSDIRRNPEKYQEAA